MQSVAPFSKSSWDFLISLLVNSCSANHVFHDMLSLFICSLKAHAVIVLHASSMSSGSGGGGVTSVVHCGHSQFSWDMTKGSVSRFPR